MLRKTVWLLFVAAVALWAGWFLRHQETSLTKATVFSEPRQLVDFHLMTMNGDVFDKASLQGKWTLMFFGYTRCPDICPTTLSLLNQVIQGLQVDYKPNVVFVSVDPVRDSEDVIKNYVPYFNQSFLGVRGELKEIKSLTRQLGIVFQQVAREDDSSYLVDHSAAIVIFDPKGHYYGIFSTPHRVKAIQEDLITIQKNYQRGVL